MDDPRPSFGPACQGGAARHQCVHQCVVPVAGSRVNHQTGWLVYDREVLVLEDDGERYGTGLEGARRLMLENANGDLLATGKESGRAGGFAVYRNQLISY
jgi:hypothetical protein